MSFAGCQINPIDVNFHLQKNLEIFVQNLEIFVQNLEIFDKISAVKNLIHKGQGVESALPHVN